MKSTLRLILSLAALALTLMGFTARSYSDDVTPFQISQRNGQEVFITAIDLARDDGAGRHGQLVKGFRRKDNPLHCVVTLSRPEEGTRVRFVWTAVEAGDKRSETIATAEVVTRSREIVADGTVSLPREWPAGRYRVQATVNKTSKSLEFSIE